MPRLPSPLYTPRRPPAGTARPVWARWLPVAAALLFLAASLTAALVLPTRPLARLDRVLIPEQGGDR